MGLLLKGPEEERDRAGTQAAGQVRTLEKGLLFPRTLISAHLLWLFLLRGSYLSPFCCGFQKIHKAESQKGSPLTLVARRELLNHMDVSEK